MEIKSFGFTKDGKEASVYTMKNKNGMELSVVDFGVTIQSIRVPAQSGLTDVVLGYETVSEYEENGWFFGGTVGRNGNRIGGAEMTIDGVTYQLCPNDGPNNLHTDKDKGFHKVFWSATPNEEANAVRFTYISKDGENGFPGELKAAVTLHLTDENSVEIEYEGISDKKTVFNMTNHTYFNLGGQGNGTILDEKIQIFADRYTEVGEGSIPTGCLPSVKGTPMDLTELRRIGDDIDADFSQLDFTSGYDHNWCLAHGDGIMKQAAYVQDERTGITMEVYTDLPGLQFYAGNYIDPHKGKDGAEYIRRGGLCLETQYYPDNLHHDNFDSSLIEAGVKKTTKTVYRFGNL